MFGELFALAAAMAVTTGLLVNKFKTLPIAKWFNEVAWRMEVASILIGGMLGAGCKLIIVLGGISILVSWGLHLELYAYISWFGFIVAGLFSGFMITAAYSLVADLIKKITGKK